MTVVAQRGSCAIAAPLDVARRTSPVRQRSPQPICDSGFELLRKQPEPASASPREPPSEKRHSGDHRVE